MLASVRPAFGEDGNGQAARRELAALSGTDIFISYSRSDRTVARHLAQRFEAENFTVWWDAALHSGETFDEVIERNLRAARAVVVLWSPRSVASRWVRAEATLADRLGKLAPVVIEECERPIIFQLTHTTDLTEWNGDDEDPVWRRLIDDLRRNVGRAAENDPAAEGRSVRRFDPAAASSRRAVPETPEPAPMAAAQLVAERRPPAAPAPSEATTRHELLASDPLEPHVSTFHLLELSGSRGRESRYVVSTAGLKIGRTAPSDVILADPTVSRAHCLVELADDRLRVIDLRSTNGTFVDGRKVEGMAFLEVGSVLKVGKIELTHRLGSPDHC